jgi:hypothetical protein
MVIALYPRGQGSSPTLFVDCRCSGVRLMTSGMVSKLKILYVLGDSIDIGFHINFVRSHKMLTRVMCS